MPPLTLLSINPEETLAFTKTPQSNTPSKILTLTNDSQVNVAFKVKTTAPKAYVVKPSYGTLRPRENQEVQIILQPQGQGADVSVSTHRFLVQAVPAPSSEEVPREQWSNFATEIIQSTKLNVQVDQREGDVSEAKTNENFRSTANLNVAENNVITAATTDTGAADAVRDNKKEFDDLYVRLTSFEQENKVLVIEKQKLLAENEKLKINSSSGGAGASAAGFSVVHLLLVAVIAAGVTFALNNLV
uniref:MSP domain-containing protein n=1 Tax=Noctiluca scintillans TaxID=2966 RepID=A0A7S1AGJ1_NOCSC|mmetsp:Transcript_45466/g.120603  ORF Transcript_45466/g.120603 Transcript_45466/m.120603 type:complete len:245 (+) Transcript_45466:66-800(+)|eukprot:CAMPEP_0194503780 /NCGR_PEP_ID=MMETSP0253-20130528/28570_1 /TAXON_ID=2966 /ORGANISM="Noctiluca scintillans" /LENGTH=244 /DNA_ID=CAMNT_0039346101 /DNA_START=66 /DNA_END=800 /DNA_ORIENTATION=+